MNRLEQSKCYLRQYLLVRKLVPWIATTHHSIEERARWCLQDLDGMASDWNTSRHYTTYYMLKVDSK